jgi:hypothetical protein
MEQILPYRSDFELTALQLLDISIPVRRFWVVEEEARFVVDGQMHSRELHLGADLADGARCSFALTWAYTKHEVFDDPLWLALKSHLSAKGTRFLVIPRSELITPPLADRLNALQRFRHSELEDHKLQQLRELLFQQDVWRLSDFLSHLVSAGFERETVFVLLLRRELYIYAADKASDTGRPMFRQFSIWAFAGRLM